MSDITTKQQTGDGGELGMNAAGEGGGDFEFDPVVTEEPPSGKKAKGLMILLLVVGLAIGSLFSMHTLTKVNADPRSNSRVEALVEDFLKTMGGETKHPENPNDASIEGYEDVVHVLTDNYTKNQVRDLGRNPFTDYNGTGGVTTVTPTGNICERAADKLVLKSVMGGTIANINGRIVRAGGVFPVDLGKNTGNVEFKLTEVGTDHVTVECQNSEDPEKKFERQLFLRGRD